MNHQRMVTTIRDALDDYHCEIHSMVVEGNKAFCRMRFTGRHTGNLLGYPASGRQVGSKIVINSTSTCTSETYFLLLLRNRLPGWERQNLQSKILI